MKPFTWSYSKWQMFSSCPAKYNYRHNLGLPDPPGPAAARGTAYHAVCEAYVKGEVPVVTTPPEHTGGKLVDWQPWLPVLNMLQTEEAVAEMRVAFDREWNPTEFTADNAWLRGVYDIVYLGRDDNGDMSVNVADWKTGRYSPSHHIQLELYSATALLLYPQAKFATACNYYLDIGPQATVTKVMERDEVRAVIEKWERRGNALERATDFRTLPGAQCAWCPYSLRKGGPCQAG